MSEFLQTAPTNVDDPGQAVEAEAVLTQQAVFRLRVAWAADPAGLARMGRTVRPVVAGLMDELVDVVALCPQRYEELPLPCPPVEILRHDRLRWGPFPAAGEAQLCDRLRARKVQLLHALDVDSAPTVRRLAVQTDLPYVVSCHGLADAHRLGRLDDRCAAVLADSEPIRRELQRARVAAEDRLHLLRPGVFLVPHARSLKDSPHCPTIVASGTLDTTRPFESVLASAANLQAQAIPFAMFVIGSGKAQRPLRRLAEKLGLRTSVSFIDDQPPAVLTDIFKASDVFISTGRGDEMDFESLLAMSAGNVVLAYSATASDFLIDAQTAILLRSNDPAELTAKLTMLLNDLASARAMLEGAAAHLRQSHSVARMVAALAGIYRQAVAGEQK